MYRIKCETSTWTERKWSMITSNRRTVSVQIVRIAPIQILLHRLDPICRPQAFAYVCGCVHRWNWHSLPSKNHRLFGWNAFFSMSLKIPHTGFAWLCHLVLSNFALNGFSVLALADFDVCHSDGIFLLLTVACTGLFCSLVTQNTPSQPESQ